ncbi:MAG: hypothetical protein GPOALKHO_001067 [Sodalis sp.]|uniref:hypothetical protein n=1 Tax=Sodalis sp. (in: enterobacteria) TaxID=1898979 RepID=UPI003873369C|nr:MAG: hypothetical protein GPOALKHO_001067 [Sodalis sp.]
MGADYIAKSLLSAFVPETALTYYRDAVRSKLVDHVNGAFLASTRQTWLRMYPIWIALFHDTWSRMGGVPTDRSIAHPRPSIAGGGLTATLPSVGRNIFNHGIKPQPTPVKYVISAMTACACCGTALAVDREDIKPGEEML